MKLDDFFRWPALRASAQPDWVCVVCGGKYGRTVPSGMQSTWHHGTCGVCGEERAVTEPRDFGYLKDWKEDPPQ